jgi:UDP-N-acetylmuramyl tripeptide synthase
MEREPLIWADRGEAIRRAIHEAAPGDLLLLAGKGHEEYQLINGQRRPFSDVAAARAALLDRQRGGVSA